MFILGLHFDYNHIYSSYWEFRETTLSVIGAGESGEIGVFAGPPQIPQFRPLLPAPLGAGPGVGD